MCSYQLLHLCHPIVIDVSNVICASTNQSVLHNDKLKWWASATVCVHKRDRRVLQLPNWQYGRRHYKDRQQTHLVTNQQ